MNAVTSMDKYTPSWLQNPMLATKKIFGCGLFTQGVRAVANTVFGYYFNYRKASQGNRNFYDPKRNDYYIICENKVVLAVFDLNKDTLNKAKKLLKDLKMIDPESQPFNRPDRIYIGNYSKISKSMMSKKSSFRYNHGKTSGRLKCRTHHTEKSTPKRIFNNKDIQVTTPKPTKNKKSKPTKAELDSSDNINRWIYATTDQLDTKFGNKSKQHAHNLAMIIARIANKDPKKAHHLFGILTTQRAKQLSIAGIRIKVGLEDLPGLYEQLNHIYEYQLDPQRKNITFKFNKHDRNYIRRAFLNYIHDFISDYKYYHDTTAHKVMNKINNGEPLNPKDFPEDKHVDNRPATDIPKDNKKNIKIPIFKI